jgi:hypothetical protein
MIPLKDPEFQAQIKVVILTLINSGLNPILISYSTEIEGFKTKSKQKGAIMNRNFFFTITTTLFLPLLGLDTIE